MARFSIMLDGGAMWSLPRAKTKAQALAALASHRERRREQIAADDMVKLRRPLGLVIWKR
jgi:hypothetical protein